MPHNNFDPERAIFHKNEKFKPLVVKKTISLRDVLDKGNVSADTELLLVAHPDQPTALIKSEMTYHHVAQGEINGEPWLVSF